MHMNPLTFDQMIALAAVLLSGLTVVIGYIRSTKEGGAKDQRIIDRLDNIASTVETTQRDVSDLGAKIDDHAARLARTEQNVTNLYHRLDSLEHSTDERFELLISLVHRAEREIVLIDGYIDTETLNILAKKEPGSDVHNRFLSMVM